VMDYGEEVGIVFPRREWMSRKRFACDVEIGEEMVFISDAIWRRMFRTTSAYDGFRRM